MRTITIAIMGEDWTISFCDKDEDKSFVDCMGYTDWTVRHIGILAEPEVCADALKDTEAVVKKVLRHEIIHAFLYESGLGEASNPTEAWAYNEEMIDWYARKGPAIYEAWSKAGAL